MCKVVSGGAIEDKEIIRGGGVVPSGTGHHSDRQLEEKAVPPGG